jgi:hypothetical protein
MRTMELFGSLRRVGSILVRCLQYLSCVGLALRFGLKRMGRLPLTPNAYSEVGLRHLGFKPAPYPYNVFPPRLCKAMLLTPQTPPTERLSDASDVPLRPSSSQMCRYQQSPSHLNSYQQSPSLFDSYRRPHTRVALNGNPRRTIDLSRESPCSIDRPRRAPPRQQTKSRCGDIQFCP